MGEMPGWFKWDDDNLTPGKSKDGGLNNNLYDADGKLKGAARFIPADKPDPVPAEKPVNKRGNAKKPQPAAPGKRAAIQGEVADVLAELAKSAAMGVLEGVKEVVTPVAKSLWEEKARPALEAKRAEAAQDAKVFWVEKGLPSIERQVVRQREKLAARKTRKAVAKQHVVIEGEIIDADE